jgi:mycothiol synthase
MESTLSYELLSTRMPSDTAAILEAVRDTQSFGKLSGEGLERLLARPHPLPGACWIARGTAGLVGIAATTAGETAATLQLLAVRPAARRSGIGRALLDRVIAAARRHHLAELQTANVLAQDEAAGAFFGAMGWDRVDTGGLRMRRELRDLPADVPLEAPVSEDYFLRTFRDEDAGAFISLINAAFATETPPRQPWTLESFQRGFRSDPVFAPDRVFLAVRRSDEAVAGTTSSWDYTIDGRRVGLIHWVAVAPEHRGRKLGVALMVRALHDMVARGHTEAYLHTNASLRHAVQLYESLGFEITERRVRYHLALTE